MPKLPKPTDNHPPQFKKITTVIIVMSGLALSFFTGVQLLIQGVENSLIAEDNKLFPNATYLTASGCQNSDDAQPGDNCKTDTNIINNKLDSKIKSYGGTIVGYGTTIKHQNLYFFISPPELFNSTIIPNSVQMPKDDMSAVIGFGRAAELVKDQLVNKSYADNKIAFVNEVRQKTIGKTFEINGLKMFIAGITPYGSNSFRVTQQDQALQPLNQILQMIDGNIHATHIVTILANNSTEFQQLLAKSTIEQKFAIIKFTDKNQAYNFYHQEKLRHNPDGLSRNKKADDQELEIGEFETSTLSSIYWLKKSKTAIAIASSVLIFITVIILSLITKRAISDNSMRLRSALSLSFKFLIIGILTAIIAAGAISYHNKELYNSALSLLFGHETNDFKLLLGFNTELFVSILVAPTVAMALSLLLIRKNKRS